MSSPTLTQSVAEAKANGLFWNGTEWIKPSFQTVEEAEVYYEMNINSESNNMNPQFENARDSWLEDNADDIAECLKENYTQDINLGLNAEEEAQALDAIEHNEVPSKLSDEKPY